MALTPILTDPVTRRNQIRAQALNGLRQAFPLTVREDTIELTDVKVVERDYGPNDQKAALMQGTSLHEPVRGTLVRRGPDGAIKETVRNYTLLNLPYFTERHTFIIDGNEYQVSNQLRAKPGVYTRRRANDELEAAFNLAKGSNFRLSLDPQKGHPQMEYGTTVIPLYPVLRELGVPHQDIAKAWGSEVAGRNDAAFRGKHDRAVDKLYGKVIHPGRQAALGKDGKVDAIRSAYAATLMDPEVNQATLGAGHDKVTPSALLDASKKLLNVYRSGDDVDDRDSLAFKSFHSVDDFIKERIGLDARTLAMKVRGRATNKNTIRELLPASPFTPGIRSFLTGSSLSVIPTQINPMEMIDQAVKVTSLGEGGISSERAIPMEARQLHGTHFGLLDTARTPESFRAGVDLRTSMLAHRDEQGNLYTPVRNVRTGKFEHLSAKDMEKTVVAFPGQKIVGMVAVMKNGQVQHAPAAQVTHEIYDAAQLYSPSTNLIPLLESIQGNRATMGSKFQTQALPLVDREAPLVQVGARKLLGGGAEHVSSWEREFAKLVNPTAPVSGRVTKVDSQYIYIDPTRTKKAEDTHWEKLAAVKRQVTLHGITCKIELEAGDKRTGVDRGGKAWERTMYAAYGYIPKTTGDDNEAVDVYVKDDDEGEWDKVYVVHQVNKDGSADEDKVMLGFASRDEAKKMYQKHVPEWCFGGLTEYEIDDFEEEYLEERRKTAGAGKCDVCLAKATKKILWGEGRAYVAACDAHVDRVISKHKDLFDPVGKPDGIKEAADKSTPDGLVRVPYETYFPFASKTYLHHDLKVKPGDEVKEEQQLGDSNYTRDGALALGRNMTVAYMPYYGLNSNDAVVISEGASKKLTSEHLYKETLDVERDMTLGREKHRQHYGSKYTAAQYRKLDENGVVRVGQKLLPHDLVVVGVQKGKLSSTDTLLGNFRKTLATPYREVVLTWDRDFEGQVTDVFVSPRRVVVTIRTQEPMRIGDKLSGRHAGKGVIGHIVPDDKMIQDESGKPVDILYTSAGIVSRINPAQIIETAVGKVALKTGKPIVVENFSGRDNVQWAKDLLKEHKVKDKETVFDPISGKKIPGILVGPQYTLRLFKNTDTNFSARNTGSYDVNLQPAKGGVEGAKGIGMMEFNGLVAHNARNVLREAATIKSQKNDEFWRAVQLGLPLPAVRSSFVYDKFKGMLHGAGIKVDSQGNQEVLQPLTDADITRMSSGPILNEKLVRAKDLAPERGGLFDPAVTGGPTGTRWAHIDLAEPVVNPVFTDPARRLLGLTNKQFEQQQFTQGGAGLKKQLNAIDVDRKIQALRSNINSLSGVRLDDAVKQIKALEALKRANLKPGDAYVLSKLPVLPPVMRPVLPGKGGSELVVGDSNYLYQNAFMHNRVLGIQNQGGALPPDEHATLRKNLHQAVGAVIGTHATDNPKLEKRNVKGFLEHLTGKTTPKSSFFQRKIMSRQQDLSGRGTAAPDPSLGMDQVGLPEDMLWSMFGKFVIARLVRRGFGAVQAKEMLESKHPAARDALLAETAERPVIINRAPSLHRFNLVGAYAVPVPGKTIRVNPFIEKGQNLDFDGDALQIHTPVLPGAVEEVKKMTMSNLIFGDLQKDDLMAAPAMESILGVHIATQKSKTDGETKRFKTKADAVAAYKRGEISLNTKVEIG